MGTRDPKRWKYSILKDDDIDSKLWEIKYIPDLNVHRISFAEWIRGYSSWWRWPGDGV